MRKLFFTFFYLQKPPWDTGISPPELLAFIEARSPGRALDLGCGTGTNVITLAQHGWQVVGVDFVGKAIRAARRRAQMARVQVDLRVEDVTRLRGIEGPFDLVLDMGCFHSLTAAGKAAYIDNLERLLAPDGVFLLYAFFKEPGSAGTGLEQSDVDLLTARLRLVDRQDGTERQRLPSAWFKFGKRDES